MDLRKDATVELEIQSLALGGNGVGRVDDLVVFVPGAYPGERVRARVTRRKPSYAEARLEEVMAASPARREPPCVHFKAGECGGCRSQDLDDRAQVEAKTLQVKETLARLGGPGLAGAEVFDCVPSPAVWRYRNKMEFAFHPGPDGALLLGLHRRDRFDDVFDLRECWIASELTNAIVHETRAFARTAGWAPYHARLHTGLVRFLAVRHLPATAHSAVNLIAARDAVPDVERWAERIADLDPAVRSVVLTVSDSRANVAFGARERVLAGTPTIEERLLGLTFEVSANSFLQTNSAQAEALYEAAVEEAALTGEERVLDLYCGAGTITLALARHAASAVGVESVEGAIADARRNAARNGIRNARFVCGEARAVLRQWARVREGRVLSPAGARAHDAKAPLDPEAYEPFLPDVVLVDPPRAGLHERVIDRVAALAPRRVVYVSCNPGTLARDLGLFARLGYATRRVRPFDMFPHTPHIECVARLEPAGAAATPTEDR
ncbi:MAG: 23S rRNA (uracil(1939)-C(5))-methyltransferase RlmD [Candidatus Eiseniibacteriota bacterium]